MDAVGRPGEGGARFSRFCAGAALALISLLMCYLFVQSMLATSDISTGEGFGEVLCFKQDSFLLNLLLLVLSGALLFLFWRFSAHIKLSLMMGLLIVWTLIAGALFIAAVKLQPSQDSFVVTFWSMQAARGDTSYYHFYFRRFPYQFGYALYEEVFFRLVFAVAPGIPEGFACMLLQAGNLVFLILTQLALIQCVGLLFHSRKAQKMTALLLLLSPHGIMTSTYLYGNLPGLGMAALAIWAFLAYQENKTGRSALLCALCMTVAVILKLNYMIVFLAICILWLICLLRRWEWKSLLCLALCVIAVLGMKDLPQRYYERRMEESFGSGISLWGWMALGFSEGQTCSGWYDPAFTVDLFENNGCDTAAAAAEARQVIAGRGVFFRAEPGEALAFFNRKFLSQWNEPTYESIWNNNVREHFSEPGRLYTLLCRTGEDTMKAGMNVYQQLIFFCVLAALISLWKRREILQCLIPVILLGGMLYHILFEAKSQYALAYFLLMIPMAAYGLDRLYGRLKIRK